MFNTTSTKTFGALTQSIENPGVVIPNIAYCSVNLLFDKVHVHKRVRKAPIVVLKRGDKKYRIVATKKTQREWLDLSSIPHDGRSSYVQLPAYIAEGMV